MSSQPESPLPAEYITYMADVTFNIDGRSVLFAGNAAQRIHENANDTMGRKYVFERHIAGNVASLFAAAGTLYEIANYFGPVDVGVAVTNLEGAVGVGRYENVSGIVLWSQAPTFNAATFTRVKRLGAASELHDAEGVALSLLGRLFAATTGRDDYTPFTATSSA
jgi:hypothetical protein